MHIVDSDCIDVGTGRPIPYFPRAEGNSIWPENHGLPELTERPTQVGPVFDTASANTPLDTFDEGVYYASYKQRQSLDQTTPVPDKPMNFSDAYLAPRLTRNERLRLTMLWYLTRQVTEDKDLLRRLQEKVDIVQEFMGWKYVIMGLLDNNTYSRIVTAGLPLANLPRRESTCAHTVMQSAGSVLMLNNMAEDWRFKHSPHVELGGLRTYAGTQLRYRTQSGVDVALGTLCIASDTANQELSAKKQAALVRFADMLTSELVSRLRIQRQDQRHQMSEVITRLQAHADADLDVLQSSFVDALRQIYPHASCSIQSSSEDIVQMEGRPPLPLSEFQDGLWEDTEAIDEAIRLHNHQDLVWTKPIRAVASKCGSGYRAKSIVVASKDTQLVFDDVDAWFIERCSMILWNVLQERSLKEALQAKERFLRGITHQLRTPIHGVLGSVDLLAEELSAVNLREVMASEENGTHAHNMSAVLATIRNSGRELMSTVNNMIKLNRWAEMSGNPKDVTLQDFARMESDILAEIVQLVPEEELDRVTVVFDNQLDDDIDMCVVDLVLLKECLQSLMLNAIQFTAQGFVLVTISSSEDQSALRFDVEDTGCGIHPEDRERIFEPYEKGDIHTRGAGLGLTIASKIAAGMDGAVTLVGSEVGRGSHFRVEIQNPGFACSPDARNPTDLGLTSLPRRFHVADVDCQITRKFARHLKRRGFTECEPSPDALNLISLIKTEQCQKVLPSIENNQATICLVPAGAQFQSLQPHSPNLIYLSSPFHSNRYDEIIRQAEILLEPTFTKPTEKPTQKPTQKPTETSVSPPATAATVPDGITNPPPAVPEKKPSVSPESVRIAAKPRALLVDDNAINLRIMRMYCEKRHIPYVLAMDGREAVEQYTLCSTTDAPINLVLMDLQMPNVDGNQATVEIRALEQLARDKGAEGGKSIIFIVTGQDSPEDRASSEEAGADEFFVKPMSLKTLDWGISRYFEGFGE